MTPLDAPRAKTGIAEASEEAEAAATTSIHEEVDGKRALYLKQEWVMEEVKVTL